MSHALQDQRPTETVTLERRIHGDDVDLAEFVVVPLGPAEPRQFPVDPGHPDPFGAEPRLSHPVLQHLHGPPAVLRVTGERPIVDLQPDLLIGARGERFDPDAGSEARGILGRKRPTQLAELALL